MKTPLRVGLLAAVVGAVMFVSAVSCQTYDFEPVRPLAIAQTTTKEKISAHALKPDLMLLLDKSGSMNSPIPGTGGTRMTQMKEAMQTFLTTNGNVARMGLTIFPSDNTCGASNASTELEPITTTDDTDPALQTQATAVNGKLQQVTASGGTPTGGSLAFIGGYPELNDPDRDDFILLLTDGLPNCNPNNPNTCANMATCLCTVTDMTGNPTCAPGANDISFCVRGCIDQDGAVSTIKSLRDTTNHAGGIRTIVVGFGSDFTGGALDTLNAMAIAGGFQATCPNGTDAECGSNNTCDTVNKVCAKAFYAAGNATQLSAALAQISANLGGDVCTYILSAQPSAQDLLSVLIDGVATPSGADTWALVAGKLQFQGALCTKLRATDTQDPVNVEVRIVQSL